MTRLVQLSLNTQAKGDIVVQMSVADSPGDVIMSMAGELPSARDVVTKYQNWHSSYGALQHAVGTAGRAIVVQSVGEYSALSGDYSLKGRHNG